MIKVLTKIMSPHRKSNISKVAFVAMFCAGLFNADYAQAQVRITAPDGFALGENVIADTNALGNVGGLTYTWSRGKSSDNSFDTTPLGSNAMLMLAPNRWQRGEYDLLRLVVSGSGVQQTVVQNINIPTRGQIRVVLVDGSPIGEIEAGKELSIDLSGVYDENNRDGRQDGGALNMAVWISGTDRVTNSRYVLRAADAERKFVRLNATYTDAMGFAHLFELEVRGTPEMLVQEKPLRNVLSAMGAMSAQHAFNAVGSHLLNSRVLSGGSGALSTPQVQFNINGTAVSTSEELFPALVRKGAVSTDSSQNTDIFGLESFAIEGTSGGDKRRWGGWLRGSWSLLEGRSTDAGRAHHYEGQGVSFYGGTDKYLGNWRVGLAAGYHSADIDAVLGSDNHRDDSVIQTHYSLLPYVEYVTDKARLRFAGGRSYGRTEVQEFGGYNCKVRMKSDWYFGGADLQYLILSGKGQDLIINASYYSNGGGLESKQCDNNARIGLPEISYNNSELSFGARAGFGVGDEFRPYMLMDLRKKFGDLRDDVGVDIGLGAEWTVAPWIFQGEGRLQVGDLTEHQRHSINGVLIYDKGWVRSQWKSGVEQIGGGTNRTDSQYDIDWVHRWDLSASTEHALRDINFGIYAERRYSLASDAENAVGANIQVEFLAGR